MNGNIQHASLESLEKTCRKHGFESLHMLMVVRNPLDFIPSHWQQTIKQGGTSSLGEFALKCKADHLKIAAKISRGIPRHEFFHLTVWNYEAVKTQLLEEFETWLNLDLETLVRPSRQVINRSMTLGELEIIRRLNGIVGADTTISYRFMDELPSVVSEHMMLSHETARKVWEEAQADIEEVNSRLGATNALRFADRPQTKERKAFSFTSDQLALIADIIGQTHNRNSILRDEKRILQDANRILQDANRILDDRNQMLAADLTQAWRDPFPHLWRAYKGKLKASVKRFRSAR